MLVEAEEEAVVVMEDWYRDVDGCWNCASEYTSSGDMGLTTSDADDATLAGRKFS